MTPTMFNRSDNWAKQKDIAVFVITRAKIIGQVEVTCKDYESALQLAKLIQRFDKENDIKEVYVFSYFVRLIRNENTHLRFSANVIDMKDVYKQNQQPHDRP